jgi:peroxiredoxin
MPEIQVGDAAPDFELPCCMGSNKSSFRLSEHAGTKFIVLAFYPLDWTPT